MRLPSFSDTLAQVQQSAQLPRFSDILDQLNSPSPEMSTVLMQGQPASPQPPQSFIATPQGQTNQRAAEFLAANPPPPRTPGDTDLVLPGGNPQNFYRPGIQQEYNLPDYKPRTDEAYQSLTPMQAAERHQDVLMAALDFGGTTLERAFPSVQRTVGGAVQMSGDVLAATHAPGGQAQATPISSAMYQGGGAMVSDANRQTAQYPLDPGVAGYIEQHIASGPEMALAMASPHIGFAIQSGSSQYLLAKEHTDQLVAEGKMDPGTAQKVRIAEGAGGVISGLVNAEVMNFIGGRGVDASGVAQPLASRLLRQVAAGFTGTVLQNTIDSALGMAHGAKFSESWAEHGGWGSAMEAGLFAAAFGLAHEPPESIPPEMRVIVEKVARGEPMTPEEKAQGIDYLFRAVRATDQNFPSDDAYAHTDDLGIPQPNPHERFSQPQPGDQPLIPEPPEMPGPEDVASNNQQRGHTRATAPDVPLSPEAQAEYRRVRAAGADHDDAMLYAWMADQGRQQSPVPEPGPPPASEPVEPRESLHDQWARQQQEQWELERQAWQQRSQPEPPAPHQDEPAPQPQSEVSAVPERQPEAEPTSPPPPPGAKRIAPEHVASTFDIDLAPEAHEPAPAEPPPPIPLAAPTETHYTNIPREWIGQRLTMGRGGRLSSDKGADVARNRNERAHLKPNEWTMNTAFVPANREALIAAIRQRTNEVWEVRGRPGGKAFLVPKTLLSELGPQYPQEAPKPKPFQKTPEQQRILDEAREKGRGGIIDNLRGRIGVGNWNQSEAVKRANNPDKEMLRMARESEPGSPEHLLAYLYDHSQDDPKGTQYQWVKPSEMKDGDRIKIGDETLTLDKEGSEDEQGRPMLRDGIDVPVDPNIAIPAREVLGPGHEEGTGGEMGTPPESFHEKAPAQKPSWKPPEGTTFWNPEEDGVRSGIQTGIFGQPVVPTQTGYTQRLEFETSGQKYVADEAARRAAAAESSKGDDTQEMFPDEQATQQQPPADSERPAGLRSGPAAEASGQGVRPQDVQGTAGERKVPGGQGAAEDSEHVGDRAPAPTRERFQRIFNRSTVSQSGEHEFEAAHPNGAPATRITGHPFDPDTFSEEDKLQGLTTLLARHRGEARKMPDGSAFVLPRTVGELTPEQRDELVRRIQPVAFIRPENGRFVLHYDSSIPGDELHEHLQHEQYHDAFGNGITAADMAELRRTYGQPTDKNSTEAEEAAIADMAELPAEPWADSPGMAIARRVRDGKAYGPETHGQPLGQHARFSAEETNYAPAFYSGLHRIAEAKLNNGMTPEQALKTLKAAGAKAEELKWTGLEEHLGQMQGKIKKAELVQWIKDHQVEVREVNKSEFADADPLDWRPLDGGYVDATSGYKIIRGHDGWLHLNAPDGGPIASRESADLLKGAAQAHADAITPGKVKFGPELWPDQTTPGHRNYKETLYIAPGNTFEGAHWDEPGVMAHMRTTDRDVRGGGTAHHVEEFQSDLEAAGLKRIGKDEDSPRVGFKDPEKIAELQKAVDAARVKLREAQDATDAAHRESNRPPPEHLKPGDDESGETRPPFDLDEREIEEEPSDEPTGDPWADRIRILNAAERQSEEDLVVARANLADANRAPEDAPLRKSWLKYLMKAAIRKAAEAGHDYVTWNTGEQENARNSLAKEVDAIHYNPDSQMLVGEKDRRFPFSKKVPPEKLKDYIGKELAAKLLASEPRQTEYGPKHTISGDDLKVGGQGNIDAYDREAVKVANEIGKQWGAKVRPATDEMAVEIGTGGRNHLPVHALPVTDAMREAALFHGQAMFSVRERAEEAIDLMKRLQSRTLPATRRISEPSADALSRAVASRAYSEKQWPLDAAEVLGRPPAGQTTIPKINDDYNRLVGSVFMQDQQDNLRAAYANKGNHAAAAAVNNVFNMPGADGKGGIKSRAEFNAALQRPDVRDSVRKINDLHRTAYEPNFQASGGTARPPRGARTGVLTHYIALHPDGTPVDLRQTGMHSGSLTNPNRPKGPFEETRTGSAENYELRASELIKAMRMMGQPVADVHRMWDTYQREGMAVPFVKGQNPPSPIGDKQWRYVPSLDRGSPDGFWVHPKVQGELRHGLDTDIGLTGLGKTGLRSMASAAMMGTQAAAYHLATETRSLFAAGPTALPGAFKEAYNLLSGDMETHQRLSNLIRDAMARRQPESLQGWNRLNPLEYMHRAIMLADNAGRLQLSKVYDRLQAAGTPLDKLGNKRDFVNQLGQYMRPLQSKMIAMLRDTSLNDFATASFNNWGRNARAIAMSPEMQTNTRTADVKLRAQRLVMTGLAAAVLPGIINKVFWGSTTGGSKQVPFMAVRLPDDEDGKVRYWDVGNILSGIRSGLRQFGATGVIEGKRRGENSAEIIDRSKREAADAAFHTVIGPGIDAAHVAAYGDTLTNRQEARLADASKGQSQSWENLKAAGKTLNPVVRELTSDRNHGFWNKTLDLANSSFGPFGAQRGEQDRDAAEERAHQISKDQGGAGQMTGDQLDAWKQKTDLVDRMRAAPDKGRAIAGELVQQGKITGKQAKELQDEARESPLAVKLKNMKDPHQAMEVWRLGTAEEQQDESIQREMHKKIARAPSNVLTPTERLEMVRELQSPALVH